DGVTYSFGVFYNEFLKYFNEGRGATSWIASILVGVTLCSVFDIREFIFIILVKYFGTCLNNALTSKRSAANEAVTFYATEDQPLMFCSVVQHFKDLEARPISSSFVNKYGCRSVTIAGSILASACMIASVFAPNVLTLCVTIGLGTGFGFGLIYLPAIVSVTCYFEKYRSLATGIAVCGSGLGTFAFAPLTEYLITEYGWRGAMLIIAALVLNCMILGALFRPVPDNREAQIAKRTDSSSAIVPQSLGGKTTLIVENNSSDHDLQVKTSLHRPRSIGHLLMPHLGKTPSKTSHTGGSEIARLALSQPVLLTSSSASDARFRPTFGSQALRKSSGIMYRRDVFYRGSLHNIPNHRRKRKRNCTWPRRKNYKVLGLRPGSQTFFKQEPPVVSHSSNRSECHISKLGSNPWLPQDAKHSEEALQLMEMNGTKQRRDDDDYDESGKRIICGCVPCSKETVDTLVEMLDFTLLKDPIFILFTAQAEERQLSTSQASMLISVIGIANLIGRIILATAFSAFCYDFYSFVIYASVFGFTIGAYVGLTSVILVDLLGLDRLTNAFGLLLLFQGIASFLGPPIAGWLYDGLNSYDPGFYVAGVTIAISGVMLFAIPPLQNYVLRRKGSEKSPSQQNGNANHASA
ncbi:hypothetical protein C0J52_09250, partial [Blattella germanica]